MKTCKVCNSSEFYACGKCKNCSREKSKKWRKENKEKISAYNKMYYENNTESALLYASEYRNSNRELLAEKSLARYHSHENVRIFNKIRNQNRRARLVGNGGRLSQNIVDKLFKLQKGKCACCGKSLANGYHLDHILPLYLGGTNDDSNVQLLTPFCNTSKSKKHPVEYMQSKGFLL